MAAQCETG